MTGSELFGGLYALTAVLYGGYLHWSGKNRYQKLAELLIVLLVPVAGVVLLTLVQLFSTFFGINGGHTLEDRDPGTDFALGDRDYNGNMVPLNDVYLLGNSQLKRQLFTDSIKQDVVTNQAILRRAIQDEDREIAYYAVSLLTAKMESLGEKIHQLEEQLKTAAPDNHELMDRYAGCLKRFLSSGYGDAATRARQQEAYIRVLEVLAQKMPEKSIYYEEEIKAFWPSTEWRRRQRCAGASGKVTRTTSGPF